MVRVTWTREDEQVIQLLADELGITGEELQDYREVWAWTKCIQAAREKAESNE
jgi:hypothetical protein